MKTTKLTKYLVPAMLFSASALPTGSALAFECISCAKEWTQVANGATLREQQVELLKQGGVLASQLKTLGDQLATQKSILDVDNKQLKDMTDNSRDLVMKQYTETSTKTIDQLITTLQDATAIDFAWTNANAEFDRLYPGFSQIDMAKSNASDETKKYKTMSDNMRDTLKNALRTMGLEVSQFKTEQKTFDTIRSLMEEPASRMRAIQIGNLIAYEAATQMQKLRVQMMAQMQAQTAYMAGQQEDKDYQRVIRAKMFTKPTPVQSSSAKAPAETLAAGDGKTVYTPGATPSFSPAEFLKFDAKTGKVVGIDPAKFFKFDPTTGKLSSAVPGWTMSGDLYNGKISMNGPAGAYLIVDGPTMKVLGSSGILAGPNGISANGGFVADGLREKVTVTADGKTTSYNAAAERAKAYAATVAAVNKAKAEAANKPADNKPADNKPADNKPADSKPADNKVADNKVADNKPGGMVVDGDIFKTTDAKQATDNKPGGTVVDGDAYIASMQGVQTDKKN